MSNLQLIIVVFIPTLAMLVGILVNQSGMNRLDARISDLEARMDSRITGLASELRAEIAAARQQAHDDIMVLIGISREHEARITRLEAS